MKKLTRYCLLTVLTLALALGVLPIQSAQVPVAEANAGTQWNASYYNNRDLQGSPVVTRIDDQINFNWAGGSPDPAVPADNFSVRWTKTVNFPVGGQWEFRAGADDGIRMWVDQTLIIDQWHGAPSGFAIYTATLSSLTAGAHDLRVEYYEETGNAGVQVTWQGPGTTTPAQPSQQTPTTGWNAQYWNNGSLSGAPLITRNENALNFQWGNGAPDGALPADNFSARFTHVGSFAIPGWWRFTVTVDGGVRVWVDTTQIIDQWNPSGLQTYTADLYELTAGAHEVRVEYWDNSGDAQIRIHWEAFNPDGTPRGDGTEDAGAGTGGDPAVKVWASVTASRLNVRRGPGMGYPVVGQVEYPDNYVVQGAVPDMTWVLIDLKDGRQGWVSNEWVYLWAADSTLNQDADGDTFQDFVFKIPRVFDSPVLPGDFTPADLPQVTVRGRVNDNLNLRDGATATASQVIGTVPVGTIVDIQARNRNGSWYLVEWQGIRGWLSAVFVSLTEGRVSDLLVSTEVVPVPPAGQVFVPTTDEGAPAVTVRGRALNNLVFRNNATLRAEQIGEIPQGTEFVVEARNRNGAWYLVTYEGQPGWVNAAFVRLIEGRVAHLRIQ